MVKHNPTNRRIRSVWTGPQSPVGHVCQTAVVILCALILVFAPLAFGAVRFWALGPILIVIGLSGVLWIVRILSTGEIPVVFSALGPPVIALAAYGVIRYGLSEIEPIACGPMMQAVGAALLFFLVLNNLRHRWHVSMFVWALVGTGTLVAGYALWQVLLGGTWVWAFPQYDQYLGGASGTFVSPYHCAAYLQMVFPIAAANFLFSRRSLEQKIVMGIACLLIVATLLLTAAPNGWLGWLASVIVLLVYIIQRGGKKSRWLMVGVGLLGLLLIVALIGLLAESDTGRDFISTERQSRAILWRSAWESARGNVLLGAGPGMFRWLYPAQRTLQGVVDSTQNEYLNVFTEYGVIGLALMLWVLVAFVMGAAQILSVRASRYSASTLSNRYAFTVGGLAAVAALAVGSVFDSSLHAPANLFTVVAIMAATLTCGVHPGGKMDEDEELPGRYTPRPLKGLNKLALVAVLTSVILLLAPRLSKSYPSDVCLRLAERDRKRCDWSAAEEHYLQAWNFDRRNFDVTRALGDFFSARATWDVARRDRLMDEALTWYDRALTANPHDADVFVKMGRAYDALGKRELASERYQRAIQVDPQNATYHAQIALHYQHWGEMDDAIASFARAYELGGDDPLPEIELRQLGKLDS
jgi:O-Antigen ligase/Tetratricopeptide repeat